MARKEVANLDWKVKITKTNATPAAQADIVWTLVQSAKVKVLGKFALLDQITWQVPAGKCTLSGHTHTVPGAPTAPIMATAVKNKAEGKLVLRKGDQGACMGAFVPNSGGGPVPCACTFEIDDAGQTKVLGE